MPAKVRCNLKRCDAANESDYAISGQGWLRLRLITGDHPNKLNRSIFRNLTCGIAGYFYQSRVIVARLYVFLTNARLGF
jgi:hypothetical protein